MSFIEDNALLIDSILLVLIIIEGLIIYVLHKKKRKNKGKSGSFNSVYREKYEKAREERDVYRSKVDQLKKECLTKDKKHEDLKFKFNRVNDDYGKVIVENQELKKSTEDLERERVSLENKIKELTRDNDELNKLIGNEPVPNVTETSATVIPTTVIPKSEIREETVDDAASMSSQSPVEDTTSTKVTQEANAPKEKPKAESPKEKTLYASFPRSAGSSIYFSDLSENRLEDSYFELIISTASDKATFKPLDFMKIRNYDPAMAAMFTEGVKPNVASTVIGIEPGKAHLEGKDWIVDNLAKIKLA